jgi:hypothetical protein
MICDKKNHLKSNSVFDASDKLKPCINTFTTFYNLIRLPKIFLDNYIRNGYSFSHG